MDFSLIFKACLLFSKKNLPIFSVLLYCFHRLSHFQAVLMVIFVAVSAFGLRHHNRCVMCVVSSDAFSSLFTGMHKTKTGNYEKLTLVDEQIMKR